MRRLYSSRRCLLEAMKRPPFWIQPVWRPVSSSRSLLTTFLVWARSSTSTSLGRSCHSRPGEHANTSADVKQSCCEREASPCSCSYRSGTCSVPGGSSRQSVSLQQNCVGYAHFSQMVDGLTAEAASSDHHHISSPVAATQLHDS